MKEATHRVLVVEDDAEIRESLVEVLSDSGYEVYGAADGQAALEKLGQLPSPPCLILLDLMMPVMDGRTFRREQLARPELSNIPVIVVSAHQAAIASSELGAAGHLAKPLGIDELLATVEKHCNRAA